MRSVHTDSILSLDGYFANVDDSIDWFKFDEESLEWSREILRHAGTILLGRRTYELFLQFWPTEQARRDEPVIAGKLAELPKVVFSRTLGHATWENTTIVRDAPEETVPRLKRESGGDIVVLGSGSLVSTLLRAGLIDELKLRYQPVVLGRGRRMFADDVGRRDFDLLSVRGLQSGVIAAHFRRSDGAAARPG